MGVTGKAPVPDPPRYPASLSVLLAAVAAGCGLCLAHLPLIRAEALYALIPREMLASGEWLTPTLQGVPYLDKPPLLYWLNALVFFLLGAREETARLVNLPLALGEVGLTCLLGARLLPVRAAVAGAGVLAGSLGFFVLHLELLPDHLITFWLLAGLYLWLRWRAAPGRLWETGFYLSLAGGFFSKGLIGLLFPVAIVALNALATGRREDLALLASPRGWLLLALPVLSWLTLMELRHPGFLEHQVLNEQFRRFWGARQPPDVNSFSLGGFWLLTLLWLLPWTPLVPGALATGWRAGSDSRLLLIWPAVILGFYSLSGCRVEYYALPALPPLALLVGRRLAEGLSGGRDRLLSLTLLSLAALALLSRLALPSLEALLAANRREFAHLTAALAPLLPRATAALAAWGLAGALLGYGRPRWAGFFLGGLAVTLLAVSFQALVALSPYLCDRDPGQWLKSRAGPGDLVVLETVEEYEYAASLAWYGGHRVMIVRRGGWPRFPRPVAPGADYLIPPELLEELWRGPGRVFVLVEEGTPEQAPWQGAAPVFTSPGRRVYVNRPGPE